MMKNSNINKMTQLF